MDNNYHTIMDVAAIREKHDCIKYLDGVIAKQNSLDKKKVKGLQAKAKKDADKRIEAYEKMQKSFDKRKSQDNILKSADGNVPASERKKKVSAGKLGWTFTGKSGPQRKTSNTAQPTGFTIGPSGQTLSGVRSEVQSDVMYGASKTADIQDGDHGQGRKIRTVRDIFPESSQLPRDFQSGGTPGTFGTMSSRNFGLNSMYSAMGNEREVDHDHHSFNGGRVADSLSSFPTMSNYPNDRLYDSDNEEFYRGIEEPSEIDTFLASLNLTHLSNVFKQQRVDMELLMTLKEDDLKGPGMELVLGERKAILKAVEERKESLGMTSEMELTQF